MKRPRFMVAGLLLATAAACGDPIGIAFTQAVGDWNATVIEFTNLANTSQQEEMIGGGATLTLAFGAGGTYSLTVTPAGGSASTETGTWTVNDGDMVWVPTVDPDPIRFDASRTGDVLTLTTTQAEYDFGSGSDEPARLRMVLQLM